MELFAAAAGRLAWLTAHRLLVASFSAMTSRDAWSDVPASAATMKLIAAKLREADERRFAPPERRPWWRRLAG